MNKFNIGQILTYTKNTNLKTAIDQEQHIIKKGTQAYVGADRFVHFKNGNMFKLCDEDIVDGYSTVGIANWVYSLLSTWLPLDELLDNYEITSEEFQEHITDALEELGMWDYTGNRS